MLGPTRGSGNSTFWDLQKTNKPWNKKEDWRKQPTKSRASEIPSMIHRQRQDMQQNGPSIGSLGEILLLLLFPVYRSGWPNAGKHELCSQMNAREIILSDYFFITDRNQNHLGEWWKWLPLLKDTLKFASWLKQKPSLKLHGWSLLYNLLWTYKSKVGLFSHCNAKLWPHSFCLIWWWWSLNMED